MATYDNTGSPKPPTPTGVLFAHGIYALFAVSAISAASVIGMLFSLVGFVGLVMAYAQRPSHHDSWLGSHFTWQIRTFWWSLLWAAIGWALIVTIIGIPLSFAIWGLVFVWTAYRIIRGWIALLREKALPI